MKKKERYVFIILAPWRVIHLDCFCPMHTLQGATEFCEYDRNDVSQNSSKQLITTNFEIWCFKSLMIRKKKEKDNIFILLWSYREARKFQIGSNIQISIHVFIQYCKHESVPHVSFLWCIYHSSRGTTWGMAAALLRTISWNKISNFIHSNVIKKQIETCKKCLLQNST